MMTLKAARVNKGLTQNEAAKLIGISRATLSSWESGRSFPTVLQLSAIEAAYNVKYDDIIFLPVDYALSVKTGEEREEMKITVEAAKVGTIIKEKGFKQCAIAKKAGFSARDLNDIICGRKTFKVEYVLPLCEAIGISPDELFGIERK